MECFEKARPASAGFAKPRIALSAIAVAGEIGLGIAGLPKGAQNTGRGSGLERVLARVANAGGGVPRKEDLER